jgi:carboxylesterase type B
MPLMAAAGINITHVQQAAEIGDRLVQALTAKDNPTAIQLTSQLISAFEAVVREVNVIHDQKARTLIMVALAVANVALHHIADVLDEESAKVPAAMRGRVAAETELIADFKRKRAWRCRSAVTGKFMVMDFCQKNPATSVVEVY